MAVTLEQVEQLRQKVDISYEEAKTLLEQTDGNLLDALILLERQGRTADGGGFFTTQPDGNSAGSAGPVRPNSYWRRTRTDASRDRWAVIREILEALSNLLHHCTENQMEVWRKEVQITSVPLLILVILIVVAFWVTVPLLLLGLICGCRYRFTGPDLGRDDLNDAMGTVSKTLDDMVDCVKHEFHGRKRQDK